MIIKYNLDGVDCCVTLPDGFKKDVLKDQYRRRCDCNAEDLVFQPSDIRSVVSARTIEQPDGSFKSSDIPAFDSVLKAVNADGHVKKGLESGSLCVYYQQRHIAKSTVGITTNAFSTILTLHCKLCDRHVDIPVKLSNPIVALDLEPEEAILKIPLKDDDFSRTVLARYLYVEGFRNVGDLILHVNRLKSDLEKITTAKETWPTAIGKLLKDAMFETSAPEDRFRRLKAGLLDAVDGARDDLKAELKRIADAVYTDSFKDVPVEKSDLEEKADKLLGPLLPPREGSS